MMLSAVTDNMRLRALWGMHTSQPMISRRHPVAVMMGGRDHA